MKFNFNQYSIKNNKSLRKLRKPVHESFDFNDIFIDDSQDSGSDVVVTGITTSLYEDDFQKCVTKYKVESVSGDNTKVLGGLFGAAAMLTDDDKEHATGRVDFILENTGDRYYGPKKAVHFLFVHDKDNGLTRTVHVIPMEYQDRSSSVFIPVPDLYNALKMILTLPAITPGKIGINSASNSMSCVMLYVENDNLADALNVITKYQPSELNAMHIILGKPAAPDMVTSLIKNLQTTHPEWYSVIKSVLYAPDKNLNSETDYGKMTQAFMECLKPVDCQEVINRYKLRFPSDKLMNNRVKWSADDLISTGLKSTTVIGALTNIACANLKFTNTRVPFTYEQNNHTSKKYIPLYHKKGITNNEMQDSTYITNRIFPESLFPKYYNLDDNLPADLIFAVYKYVYKYYKAEYPDILDPLYK